VAFLKESPVKISVASLFALMFAGSALADLSELADNTRQPSPPAPTTSSDTVDNGGVLVSVVVGKTNVQAEPLTVRVEMKNTLDRVVGVYTDTSHWSWHFQPVDAKGEWTLSQRFAEARVWSVKIQPGKTVAMSFTTHSARGQEYVFERVGERGAMKPLQQPNALPVGRYRLTIGMEMSTFSRPTTQPEPWEGKLTTTPVEFEVVLEKPAAASQPADDAFQIRCKKPEDRVAVTVEGDSTVLTVTCPSGIGEATIERNGDAWPKAVIVRLNLKGLESLVISNGKTELSAAVGSGTGDVTLRAGGQDVAKGSPNWMEIRRGEGFFRMTLPKALLDDKAKTITVKWIDFYRG